MEYHTKSAEETKNLGRKIGSQLKGGEIFALVGELGAGKTTFIQGLAEGMGITNRIISPTFILMRRYPAANDTSSIRYLYHLDTYRLEKNVSEEVKNLGIDDEWGNTHTVVVIEWAEKIADILPEDTIWITFEQEENNKRKIEIKIHE